MKSLGRYFSFGDQKVFHMINDKIKCRLLDSLMPYITKLGGVFFSIIFPLVLALIGRSKMRLIGLESMLALSISHLAVQILKRTISRLRPYDILEKINTFNIKLEDYSFPSGHTTASFSIAMVIALNLPTLMTPILFGAAMVGISRVYLGVHYPSDVLVGAVLGILSSITAHSYLLSYFG